MSFFDKNAAEIKFSNLYVKFIADLIARILCPGCKLAIDM